MSRFFRTYEQAIEFLFGRINYERLSAGAYTAGDLKLDRVRHLLSRLGDPQEQIPAIHIAGTKGKGSTSVMAAEMLSAAGYRTGLFTSPHISAFEERMVVDGVRPTSEQLLGLVNRLVEPVEAMDRVSAGRGPTYFELATALAWLYFLDCGAQVAVLEVGLGGRLDATNVCDPLVGIITNISRDHTNILGSTVAEIAREKAGIIKPGVPVVSGCAAGPAADVVAEVCRDRQSPLWRLGTEVRWRPSNDSSGEAAALPATAGTATAGAVRSIDIETPRGAWKRIPVPLLGEHQSDNAALAVAAVTLLSQRGMDVAAQAVAAGMANVRWPARIEVVGERPTVVIDAAHNWASTNALLRTLDERFSPRRRLLIFAGTRDKDVGGQLRRLLPRFDSIVLTQYQSNPRSVPLSELAALVHATATVPCHAAPDAVSAWRLARRLATADDLVCITGSFFVAAELREAIFEEQASRRSGDVSVRSAAP